MLANENANKAPITINSVSSDPNMFPITPGGCFINFFHK